MRIHQQIIVERITAKWFDGKRPAALGEIEIADQVHLRYLSHEPLRDFGQVEVISLLLSFATGVASNVVAELLSNHLRRKDEKQDIKLIIYNARNRRGYPIDLSSPSSIQEAIDKVISEKRKLQK